MDNFKRYQVENYKKDFIHIGQIKWDNEGLKINLEAQKNPSKISMIFADTVISLYEYFRILQAKLVDRGRRCLLPILLCRRFRIY